MTRIAVLGSLMQDLVVRAPRLPKLGETMFGHSFEMFVGGKGGNQAVAAARLGAEHVVMIGAVGDDAFAPGILAALKVDGVDITHVHTLAAEGTGVAIPVVLDDGSNTIFSIPRANLAITPNHVRSAADVIASADVLLLQLEVAYAANVEAVRIAADARVPVVLNAAPAVSPAPEGLLDGVATLVVNELEADALAGPDRDRLAQARSLRALGPGTVVITLGDQGAVAVAATAEIVLPAFPVTAIDTVGAGDAFCGALAVSVAEGSSLEDALLFASAAGAIAVTRKGAAPALPARREVQELIEKGTFTAS